MYIDKKDIRAVHREIGQRLEWADTVMIPRYGAFDAKSIQFLSGDQDYQEFMQTEPDAYSYDPVSPRTLYQLLFAIDKEKVPGRTAVLGGVSDRDWMDIGSMLEDRQLIKDLHRRMQRLDWTFESSGDLAYRLAGYEQLEEIKKDLLKLCKDGYGLSMAGKLWDQYVPTSHFDRPHLFSNRSEQWSADTRARMGSLIGSNSQGGKALKYSAMEGRERDELRKQLQPLGSLLDFSVQGLYLSKEVNVIPESQKFGRLGKPDFLDIKWMLDNGKLHHYEVVLRKHVEIPGGTVAGVSLKRLESDMGRIDWTRDWFPAKRGAFVEYDPQRSLVNTIARDLDKLGESRDEGKDALEKLALKFLAHTVNGKLLNDLEQLKAGYERRLILEPDTLSISALQAYNLLDGRSIMKKLGAADRPEWEWFAINPAKRNPDGSSVIERVPDTEALMLVAELTRMGGKIPSYEDVTAVRNGSKVLVPLEVDGIKADRIVYADPRNKRLVIDPAEGEHYGLYQVTDDELYRSRLKKAESFLPALETQAAAIGVDKTNMARMSEEIIIRGRSFDLTQEGAYDNDRVLYLVEVGKNPGNDFSIHQIRVDLRKGPHFSEPVINTVDVPMLEKMMRAVDWKQDFTGVGSVQFHSRHPGGNKEMQDVVSQVQADLGHLFAGPSLEGADIAATLALKYLKDTPNEQLVPSLVGAMDQKQVIITFPGKPEFSLESLYHLMNNRFAMGKRLAGGAQGETREWYKLDREKTLMGIHPPVTLVPGGFSVAQSLARHPSLVELKMPTVLDRTIKGLENGGLMAIHLNREKVAVPMFVYADPVKGELMIDLAVTLARGNFLEQAMAFKGETMTLDRLMTLVGEAPAAKQDHKKWLGGGKNGSSDDPDENNLGRGRKK